MNDTTGKTASCLAITEKKPHRPGGCVGIFFQLFDWNRRFAKKKLFSKKLLPPARAKQASKKFGGDEKLTKLRLIAHENSGGFPHVKKNGTRSVDVEQNHEIRSPNLVARLMGLEYMPAVEQDKSNKASFSGFGNDMEEKFLNDHSGFIKEDLNFEKGNSKNELRPQKLQKTGLFERRPVTRFGAEALQLKSVLSRSRKHHPKLASPVKSPRMVSGRNAPRKSRLFDAAAKILEPGLQATSRAKCALTYLNTTHHAPGNDIMLEETIALSLDPSKGSSHCASAAKSLKGQHSCKNCGNLVDIVDSRPNVGEHPSVFASTVSNHVNPSPQGLERSQLRHPVSSLEQDTERIFQKSREQSESHASRARNNMQTHSEPIPNRKPLNQDGRSQRHLTSQQCKPQNDVSSSIGFKHKARRENHMLQGRDSVPQRAKCSNLHSNRVSSAANAVNETKDFVALNRSLSGRTRTRIPVNVDNCKFNADRKSGNRRDDPLLPLQKRRSLNVGRQGGSPGFITSTLGKQRNVSCDAVAGKGVGLHSHSTNCTSIESRLSRLGESKKFGSNKDNAVISFTFSAPIKHKNEIPTEMEEKRRDQNAVACNSTPPQSSKVDDRDEKTCLQRPFPLRGDTLGAILEQKLKELTCQQEDELSSRDTLPKKTTAMILQELISALTAEKPVSQDGAVVGSNQKDVSCYGGHMLKSNMTFQAKMKTMGASVGYSRDYDHLSPGSVLEASFSNDSCFSSSLDDNSGHKLHHDSMDCSYDESQLLEPDADLLDSATSLSKGRSCTVFVTDLTNHISEVLYSLNIAEARLSGSKLVHAKEVILSAELVFGNIAPHNSDGIEEFSICRFLLDELETLAGFLWTNSSCFLGLKDAKEGNLVKGFVFDCVMEYLDSRYDRYSKSGFRAWTRLPLCMDAAMLIHKVVEEIRKWTDLAGLIPDELIEREMSHSLGKWTDFEIEEFETGAEIDGDILQILVDEVVRDLWDCRLRVPLDSCTAPCNS
ncbi:uncharacterized protein LOC132316098 [Cornus florida]|uniref:uncharacterized protein LOC132316098 n=1 Tax=Cornus florida TaxID=4283 RepID=UPI0028A21905|nr:uncharacterized protein LOC132316098 [Cornus florida]